MDNAPPGNAPPPSSTHAGRPNGQGELAFLNFLRSTRNTVRDDPRPQHLNRTDSAERKRRHTGSEHDPRMNPPGVRSPYTRVSAQMLPPPTLEDLQRGSSRDNAIDLTTPPRPARPSFNSIQGGDGNNNVGGRESDVVVPRWQPDHEATQCPVCHTDFGVFYRRHHCRKCGRVVCSNCSPHRITIPRQYIVQPPNPFYEDEANPGSPGGINPALGGGEVVRVCNPCVPDPWTPPDANSAANTTAIMNPLYFTGSEDASSTTAPRNPILTGRDPIRPEQFRQSPSRNRSQTYQNTTSFGRDPPPAHPFRPAGQVPASMPLIPVAHQGLPDPRLPHRYSSSGGSTHYWRPAAQPSRPPPPPPGVSPRRAAAYTLPLPPPPGREVREEDECPVCGVEMPPGEKIREAHINACIAARFPSQQPRSAPAAAEAIAAAPEGSRPRAASCRARGMVVYTATEKDCMTGDGHAQECVICFEDFEEGDEMGRMECLCKFHRACIRQWWDTKGQGSCPTHQLQE